MRYEKRNQEEREMMKLKKRLQREKERENDHQAQTQIKTQRETLYRKIHQRAGVFIFLISSRVTIQLSS